MGLRKAEARIVLSGIGTDSRVVLDGENLSARCRYVRIEQRVGEFPRIELELYDVDEAGRIVTDEVGEPRVLLVEREIRSALVGLDDALVSESV